MRRRLLALCCLATAIPAVAQDIDGTTGTRLRREADQSDGVELQNQFAQCMATRFEKQSAAWLGTLPGSDAEKAILSKTDLDSCFAGSRTLAVEGKSLRMDQGQTRLMVAKAIVERRAGELPSVPVASSGDKRWFDDQLATLGDGKVDRNALGLEDFGQCTVQTDWPGAVALVRSRPASTEERAAVSGIAPALGSCLSKEQTIKLDRKTIRLIVANGIYHVAFGDPVKLPAGGN